MDIHDLLELRDGRKETVYICSLESPVTNILKLQTSHIYIKTKELHHILRHVDISKTSYLAEIIADGLLVQEIARQDSLVACYQHKQHRYKVALKITKGGHEIWVASMHRTKPKQTASILKRSIIIRKHR